MKAKPRYRTCSGCRALQRAGTCELGFETEKKRFGGISGPVIGAKPKELCPKPKTTHAFVQELKIKLDTNS